MHKWLNIKCNSVVIYVNADSSECVGYPPFITLFDSKLFIINGIKLFVVVVAAAADTAVVINA